MQPSDIVAAREALGLTQEEVAARARVSEQTVSRIERGIRVRPNSLKDVYAVLGLVYEMLDTIKLVMPDRLIEDPNTQIMRRTAQGLPHIEYLMRPDPRAWSQYVKVRLRKNPIRTFFKEGIAIAALMVVLSLLCVIYPSLFCYYNYAEGDVTPFLLFPIFGLVFLFTGIGTWISFIILYDDIVRCPDYACGYAISADAIWKMNVDEDRIRLKRISLTDCIWRQAIHQGADFIKIRVRNGEEVEELDRMPAHPGIIALIERPRTNDRDRTLPLSAIHPTAA